MDGVDHIYLCLFNNTDTIHELPTTMRAVDPNHICCCPSGSIPVDGSSRSTTEGFPRMLSTKHSCNKRDSPWGITSSVPPWGVLEALPPEPCIYLSLHSLWQRLHRRLQLVLQLERICQPEERQWNITILSMVKRDDGRVGQWAWPRWRHWHQEGSSRNALKLSTGSGWQKLCSLWWRERHLPILNCWHSVQILLQFSLYLKYTQSLTIEYWPSPLHLLNESE